MSDRGDPWCDKCGGPCRASFSLGELGKPPPEVHSVTIPLDGTNADGTPRTITIHLPKPLAQLSAVEVNEIVESLKRLASRRGSA